MLKKCSSLLLALALITVLFTGCRGNAKNENQTGDPGTSTTSATTATKTADTTVRPTNVGSRSYSKEKVVWGPGNIADHARPQEPERLQKQYPGLKIAGTHDGYFKEDAPVVEAIRESGADCVFVCLGAPKQELWMAKNGPATGAHLLCGLGGSLDVFAGTVERAPKFWSDHGLEWFYRLCKEPKRIGRMMKLPLFLVHVRQEKGKRK